MSAPILGDRPEFTCWLCGNLGALRPFAYGDGEVAWVPFKADGQFSRGEHVCPACHGIHNPHRTEFPIRDEAVDRLVAQRYNSEYAELIVNRLTHIAGSAEVDDDEFPLAGDEPPDPPDEE